MIKRILMLVIASFFLLTAHLAVADSKPKTPGKKDKCPVCGMFTYKYPDWVGQITFSDGSTYFFDGAKDLFKYYFRLEKYNPGKTEKDISEIWVTEYYDMTAVDAKTALFVIGSDVFGPMGKELIPFKTMDAAREFKRDHRGTAIIPFAKVTPAVLEKLD